MNLKQLYYFTVIAETGNFTAAAGALGLSQPPLSRQIMALEEEMGVRLMDRKSRKVELTDAGLLLYGRAKNILEMAGATLSDVRSMKTNPGGVLKLGTISSSGSLLTDRLMPDFCARCPRVRFELSEGNTYELLEKLKNGLIECAIVRTPFNSDGLICSYGEDEPLTAVGRPEYFEHLPGPWIRLTDLIGKPLISYRRFDPIISLAFQNIGMSPDIFCKNDDSRTCLLWAGSGLGVALVPLSISSLPFSTGLAMRKIRCDVTVTRMAAVYRRDGHLSTTAREFVNFFTETAGGGSAPLSD